MSWQQSDRYSGNFGSDRNTNDNDYSGSYDYSTPYPAYDDCSDPNYFNSSPSWGQPYPTPSQPPMPRGPRPGYTPGMTSGPNVKPYHYNQPPQRQNNKKAKLVHGGGGKPDIAGVLNNLDQESKDKIMEIIERSVEYSTTIREIKKAFPQLNNINPQNFLTLLYGPQFHNIDKKGKKKPFAIIKARCKQVVRILQYTSLAMKTEAVSSITDNGYASDHMALTKEQKTVIVGILKRGCTETELSTKIVEVYPELLDTPTNNIIKNVFGDDHTKVVAYRELGEQRIVELQENSPSSQQSEHTEDVKHEERVTSAATVATWLAGQGTQQAQRKKGLGKHKELGFELHSMKKVTVRKLLESKISESEFKEKFISVFPDLKMYTAMDFVNASYSSSEYQNEWIVTEDSESGTKYLWHKGIDDATRSTVTEIMETYPSERAVKRRMSKVPGLKYMNLWDSLMAVYGEKFYAISDEIRESSKPLLKHCSLICDRIRFKALGAKSPAANYIINDISALTHEQKLVVAGMLHNKLSFSNIAENMTNLFPGIHLYDGHTFLKNTFGADCDTFITSSTASIRKHKKAPRYDTVVVTLKESMKQRIYAEQEGDNDKCSDAED